MRLAQMVDLVRPHTPQTLISDENFEQVRRVASHFPIRVASCLGFETELCSDQAHVDFAFNLSNDGLDWISHTDSLWPRIRQFCTLWGESGEPPYADGGTVWLEFDLPNGPEKDPSLFFALRDSQSYIRSAPAKGNRSIEWICHTLIPTAWERPVSPSLKHNLLHTLESCPNEVSFLQMGLMLARDIQALRLCLFKIPPQEVLPFLHSIDWRGNEGRLVPVLERYSPFFDSLCLHLDIGESILPTLGVELYYDGEKDLWKYQPPQETRWKLFFDRLVADGLCLPAKADALLNWPSRTTFRFPLIENLIAAVNTPHALSVLPDGMLMTGLGHIKFSLSPVGETRAKAYFGACYDQQTEGLTMTANTTNHIK